MRTVLRDGRTEGRVSLAEAIGPNTIAVGALEGLAAEITVIDGVAHLAEVEEASSADGLSLGTAVGNERATLLVAADVESWSEHPLGEVRDLHALESRLAALARSYAPGPLPIRVEGTASRIELHVLDHSCPIANPHGPSPWRYAGTAERTVLVGFRAEDAGGILTHHGQTTHVHAWLPEHGTSGHLDDVAFLRGARLYLPSP